MQATCAAPLGGLDTGQIEVGPYHSGNTKLMFCAVQIGDVIDMHQYVGPNAPLPTLTRASVLGEFGGLGLRLEGHVWIPEDSFSYQMMNSPAELEVRRS